MKRVLFCHDERTAFAASLRSQHGAGTGGRRLRMYPYATIDDGPGDRCVSLSKGMTYKTLSRGCRYGGWQMASSSRLSSKGR